MNKVKLLSIVSVFLIIANIILIWFILSQPRPQLKPTGPKKAVIEKLHFDENQVKEYEKLISWHKLEIKKSEQKMLELKQSLYTTLTGEGKTAIKDTILLDIGKLQNTIEGIHYKHFQDIKNLCRQDQKKYFDLLTSEITELFPRTKNKQH